MPNYKIIDISDLIREYNEFEDELFDIEEKMSEHEKGDDDYDTLLSNRNDILDDDKYIALKDFVEGLPDIYKDSTMVDSYDFESYVEQSYEDMMGIQIPDGLRNYIDWNGVAHDMASEYDTLEYDGNEYYVL